MPEAWKPVPGYEGLYEVSDHGRVRSLARMVRRSDLRGGGMNRCRGKILKPRPNFQRRLAVSLSVGGTSKNASVHRLVMAAFVGTCPDGCEVNHKDGNCQNNRLSNLEYCTHQQNQLHAHRNGLLRPPWYRGESHPRALVTEDDVRNIRTLRVKGHGLRQLASRFGVGVSTISAICTRRNWSHVP